MDNAAPQGCLSGLKRKSRLASFLLLLVLTPMLSSCYGRFPLTRYVYHINGEIGGENANDSTQARLLQSVVMWVFIIIPVYGVATFADVIVFNLVEFWSGEPVMIGEHVTADGTRVALVPDASHQTAVMTVTSKDGKVLATERVIKVSDRLLEVRHENGKLAATAERMANGDLIFKDPAGRTLSTVPADKVSPASML